MSTWLAYNSADGVDPKKAAVIILYEQRDGTALFIRRNDALAFMGGHHAFPGGGVSRHDTGERVRNAPDPDTARYLTAAVREVFEETGLLLVSGNIPDADTLGRERFAVARDASRFDPFLAGMDGHIDAALFVDAGRWITPSFSPIRFDTRYFLYRCDAPLPATAMGPTEEITDVVWMTPQQALRRRGAGIMQLSTPLVFVLQRLAAFPLDDAVERLQHTPGFSDAVMDYIEPVSGVHIVPVQAKTLPPATHTNCIILGETELAIIDPGVVGEEQRRFVAHLESICEVVGGRPVAILLTHDHPDHSAFAQRLSDAYAIPVYGHALSVASFSRGRALGEGDIIALDGSHPWRVRALETPGHHPGHLCYFEESSSVLACGDMIANPGTIMIDGEGRGDMTAYLDNLEKLAGITACWTIPGHGAPLRNGEGVAVIRGTIEHRLMREGRIQAALDSGAGDLQEILKIAYADTPEALHPLALRQLKSHLARLRPEGGSLPES